MYNKNTRYTKTASTNLGFVESKNMNYLPNCHLHRLGHRFKKVFVKYSVKTKNKYPLSFSVIVKPISTTTSTKCFAEKSLSICRHLKGTFSKRK